MNSPIRDYIYLDVERLRSIYAQISGGLVESIIQSEQVGKDMGNVEGNLTSESSQIREELFLGSERTERRVLHDFLFSTVEQKLEDRIVCVNSSNLELIALGRLVKVEGNAEIDDGDRLRRISTEFNLLHKYISLMPMAVKIQERIWELEDQINRAKGKQQPISRKVLQGQLEALSTENLLKSLHVGVSPIIAEGLDKLLDLLYAGIFEFKVIPDFSADIVFRGILNRQYLREDPTLIYAKYGSRTQVRVTMLGQVTAIYERNTEEANAVSALDPDVLMVQQVEEDEQTMSENEEEILTSNDHEISNENPEPESSQQNMRDAIETVYGGINNMEKLLMVSSRRETVVLNPIAVYQQFE